MVSKAALYLQGAAFLFMTFYLNYGNIIVIQL
jgi:hypothetical protein